MFQSILSKLVTRTGARWAMIVGVDGVLPETNSRSFRTQAEGLAAEYGLFYRASRKAAGDTDMGGLLSSLLVTQQGKLLFQTLTGDYFLILLLEPDAHAGKALYEMSRLTETIERELVF